MSADLFVQSPYSSQSFNRYSYVANNPLSLVDPSGYAAMCNSFTFTQEGYPDKFFPNTCGGGGSVVAYDSGVEAFYDDQKRAGGKRESASGFG